MSRLFKRWWLLVAAIMTAGAVTVAGAVPALAAEPGEGSSWNREVVNNGATLQSPSTYSEARSPQTGAVVQVFRGLDNHVWIGVNNGPIFNAGGGNNTTETGVAPTVVYSNGWFYAFQTGTDNRIYWARAFDGIIGSSTPSVSLSFNWSNWTAISGNPATQETVSVASAPGNGLLMTWQGVGQTTLYSAWLQNGSDVFNPTRVITNAHSNNPPSVTFDSQYNEFVLVFRGLFDNQVYRMGQVLGQSTWSSPEALTGITTPISPTIASDSFGNLLVTAVDFNGVIWLQAINTQSDTFGWREESTGQVSTDLPLWISVIGSVFYIIATASNLGGDVEWKGAWNAAFNI